MEIKILVFGQIADITGAGSITLSGVKDTDELKQRLIQQFPDLLPLEYSIAINKKIVRDNSILQSTDTIALLPPFSGG